MKKTKISKTEIDALATWIEAHAEHIHIDRPEDSKPPAVKVIHCVLSLNRSYDSFVLPRLNAFAAKHPETQTVHELADLIASFPTPHTFMQQELNYNYEELAYTLQSVVEFVCKIVENEPKVLEEVVLKNWAIQAKPEEYQTLNIRRFGIAGFQYLRMLLGADTVKPDIHVRRYVSKIIDRNVSNNELILLLEAAAKQANRSVRAVDRYIWTLKGKQAEKGVSMLNVGEQLVSSYLRFIKDCDFVETNVYTGEKQGEIDVIGLNTKTKMSKVYICEVAIHLTTGIKYSDDRDDNIQKLTDKFSRGIEYARRNMISILCFGVQ